jgi:hypothetical protein
VNASTANLLKFGFSVCAPPAFRKRAADSEVGLVI